MRDILPSMRRCLALRPYESQTSGSRAVFRSISCLIVTALVDALKPVVMIDGQLLLAPGKMSRYGERSGAVQQRRKRRSGSPGGHIAMTTVHLIRAPFTGPAYARTRRNGQRAAGSCHARSVPSALASR